MHHSVDWSEAWGRPVKEDHWECTNPNCGDEGFKCDNCGEEISEDEYGDNDGYCDKCQEKWLEEHPQYKED